MTPQHAKRDRRALDIFVRALERPEGRSLEDFLTDQCGDDLDLRRRVEGLLAHHLEDDFLEPSAGGLGGGHEPMAEKFGDVIGRYKLQEKIGEGGCGVVYLAEQQEPVRRRVALKIIKPGMDSQQVIARFEAERQALALMDHPGIAKVLDGGATPTGRPYFVMELVRGLRITDFCDQRQFGLEQRLDLFVQVCQAVQHAHQKGIIHRDLKPSNILVTETEGTPMPKVIDFGIAKATEQRLTEKTLFTQFAHFLGTPAYMSPEQAAMTILDVDTRSDIYSLGVLLYELLTGTTPFDGQTLAQSGVDEMRRIIRELEPARPSTRLTQRASRAGAASAAEAPKQAGISSDLDWIVMRCLEKDRGRRYESASGLAADIQRHLRDEPVVACPPSAAYRFRKLVRRNKVAFAAGGAVAAAVLAGLGTSTTLFLKERQTRRRAEIAEGSATQSAEHNRRQLLRLRVDTGARFLRDGNFAQALSWFTQAYKLDRANTGSEETHQSRLASLFEQCPRPMRMWFHAAPVTAARLSPDGRRVLSVTATESAVWDVESGRSLATAALGSRDGQVEFTPDGTRAVIGDDERPSLWDLTTTPPTVRALAGGTQALRPQWHPAGEWVTAITGKSEAAVWDSSGHRRHTMTHEAPAEILAVGFLPGEYAYEPPLMDAINPTLPDSHVESAVMTIDSLGVLRFWNPDTGERISQRELEPKSAPWQLAFFDLNFLLTVHNDDSPKDVSHARVWSLATCRPNGEALGHDGPINGALITLNSAVTWSRDGTARLWSVESGGLRASPLLHGSEVTAAARSQDLYRQTLLATGCADGMARVWVPGASKTIGPPMLHGSKVTSVSFGPALHSLLTGSADGMVRLWNIAVASKMEVHTESSPSVLVTYGSGWGKTTGTRAGLLFHGLQPGEPRLFPIHWRGRLALTLGDVVSEETSLALVGQEVGSKVEYEVFQPDGRTLGPVVSVPRGDAAQFGALSPNGVRALVRIGNTVRVWDPRTGQTVGAEIDVGFRPNWPRFSHDGAFVALGDTKKVVVWDIAAGREAFPALSARGHHAPSPTSQAWIDPMQFDRSGHRLLTVGDVPEENLYAAQAWDVSTGQATLPPLRHEGSINFASFSPDGQWIATCGDDRTARVWDARTGQPRLEAIVHPDRVATVCFSHDGRRLYTACGDGLFRIWDPATGEPLAAPTGLPVPTRYRPHAFPLLGGRLVHQTNIYNIAWESPRGSRPLEDWEIWSELLCGQRVDENGERRRLTAAEWRDTWSRVSTRFPEEGATSLARREAWNLWMSAFSAGSGHGHTPYYLNELIEWRPDIFVHRWHRADALKVLNDWRGVAADLRVAARLKPDENAVWAHLVMAELMVGDLAHYQEASAEMARRLVPGDRRADFGGWAVLAAYRPNPPEVIAKLLATLEADGPPSRESTDTEREHDFHMARGALSLRLGRPAEAIAHLEKARSVRDGDRSVIGFLALAHQAAGNPSQASALRDELRQRLATDERLHFTGRLMDVFGERHAAGLLLREADEAAE